MTCGAAFQGRRLAACGTVPNDLATILLVPPVNLAILAVLGVAAARRHPAALLRPAGIATVYVVTHPRHMRRTLVAFARAGLAAVPAPLPPQGRLRDWVPRASGRQRSDDALHEWTGWPCYAWRAA